MTTVLIIVAILICVLIGAMILIQEPKGGGLASGFSGSNILGVQRTGDILEKGTWTLAIALMVLAMLINIAIPKGSNGTNNDIQNEIQKTAPATTMPAFPSAKPTGDTTKK